MKSRVLFCLERFGVGTSPESESDFSPPWLPGLTPRSVASSSIGGSPVPQLDVELSSDRSCANPRFACKGNKERLTYEPTSQPRPMPRTSITTTRNPRHHPKLNPAEPGWAFRAFATGGVRLSQKHSQNLAGIHLVSIAKFVSKNPHPPSCISTGLETGHLPHTINYCAPQRFSKPNTCTRRMFEKGARCMSQM
jgi:hypothetical protein